MGNRSTPTKMALVTARIHESEKEKLKNSGYNARHAIEYFNKVSNTLFDSLRIEEFFLNKEIESMKLDLIAKEMRLEEIMKQKDELYRGKLSDLRIESYQKIISLYNEDNTSSKGSFDEFVERTYVHDVILKEVVKDDVSFDEFMEGLLGYYHDVIQVCNTE